MVGATGFEPATPCPPVKCATRLRHAPKRRPYRGRPAGLQRLKSGLIQNGIEARLGGLQRFQDLFQARPLAGADGRRPRRVRRVLMLEVGFAEPAHALGSARGQEPLDALFAVEPLHALDLVAARVEQRLDALQHGHVLRPVETPPAGALHRLHERALGLPEAQHILGNAKLVGGFGNGAERVGTFGQALGSAQAASCMASPSAPLPRAFITWDARKVMTRRGSMAAGSPVLGLRPMRARFARTWNTPKPDSLTVSPRSRASAISSRVRSTSVEHSCRERPTSSCTASHRSARVSVSPFMAAPPSLEQLTREWRGNGAKSKGSEAYCSRSPTI